MVLVWNKARNLTFEQFVDDVGGAGVQVGEVGAWGGRGWQVDPEVVVEGALEADDVRVGFDLVQSGSGDIHEDVHPVAAAMVVEDPLDLLEWQVVYWHCYIVYLVY